MSSPNLLMLDSGAFSVWNKGATIDIDDYINFCKKCPGVTYYVNLDVIPGAPGTAVRRTPEMIEGACKQGWKNYLKMVSVLPVEKVIPVYHRGESLAWLEKYLDFGTPYLGIGLSGALGVVTAEKKSWISQIKKYILNSAGRPIIKTHGFAVTAWEMMKILPWHSVDSASWVRQASYGTIYIPRKRGTEWKYDLSPFLLNTSPKSPSKDEFGKNISVLTPTIKAQVLEYLKSLNLSLGSYELVDVGSGYKLKDNELWWVKDKKNKIMRITERGVTTCHQRRFFANMKFIHRVNDVIDVDHIYFAGAAGSLRDNIEYRLKRRLLSYHTIKDSKRCLGVLAKWMEQAEQPQPLSA